jgi:hypothetical protein
MEQIRPGATQHGMRLRQLALLLKPILPILASSRTNRTNQTLKRPFDLGASIDNSKRTRRKLLVVRSEFGSIGLARFSEPSFSHAPFSGLSLLSEDD